MSQKSKMTWRNSAKTTRLSPFWLTYTNKESSVTISLIWILCFDSVTPNDVNVGLHGLVVEVTCPFHHHIRCDTEPKGIDNKGVSAGMGSHHFPFGMYR